MLYLFISRQQGQRDVLVAGGFESMSNIPYYLLKARAGYRLGHGQLIDGVRATSRSTDTYTHCARAYFPTGRERVVGWFCDRWACGG